MDDEIPVVGHPEKRQSFSDRSPRPESSKRQPIEHDNQQPTHRYPTKRLAHDDYNVAWVSALPIELAAARAMLDEIHQPLQCGSYDTNSYVLGNIGPHNVVIACLPSGDYGLVNAAVAGSHIQQSFPSIEIRFMVGIGGGVPSRINDIRLGDVVVSQKVLQYDYGKTIQEGRFIRTRDSIKPPQALLTAVATLQAYHEAQPTRIPAIVSEMVHRNSLMARYSYPYYFPDRLFQSSYEHDLFNDSCESCDQSLLEFRHQRTSTDPKIHYGVIASGNQVIKHARTRDSWSESDNVLCFEMEAAGLMDHFPCLIIRGICDYADSHKSKEWQRYAAATAAGYAKELLGFTGKGRDYTG